MIRRVPHLALALLAVAALLSPPALASGGKPKKHKHSSDCGTSALCVYHEPNPTASGGYVTVGGKAVPLSAALAAELAKLGGKDARVLQAIATSRTFGAAGRPNTGATNGPVNSPGALLAALDLGPGPIALFATLLAGATAFALGRALRRRRAANS